MDMDHPNIYIYIEREREREREKTVLYDNMTHFCVQHDPKKFLSYIYLKIIENKQCSIYNFVDISYLSN